jgi:nucleoside-diphosphate-sugar epimerase
LKGDSSKLKTTLGWEKTYTFESMLDEMIKYWRNKYGL